MNDAKAVLNTLNTPKTCDEIAAILKSERATNRGLDILFDLKLIHAFWEKENSIYIRKFKKGARNENKTNMHGLQERILLRKRQRAKDKLPGMRLRECNNTTGHRQS